MPDRLTGQFWGEVESSAGQVSSMLCIDLDRPDEFMIHLFGEGIEHKAIFATATEDGSSLRLTPRLLYKHAANGSLILPNLTEAEQRDMKSVTAVLQPTSSGYEGRWNHTDGTCGALSFRMRNDDERVIAEECGTWERFKAWATRMRRQHGAAIYRGHGSKAFRLETTLSRSGRSRIERYCEEVIPQFRNHAEAVLSMKFDKESAEDYAMVLGLAQHHGLPTPLLDWTASPYVAAFFAFSDAIDARRDPDQHSHVRVFALNKEFVNNTTHPIVTLPRIGPYVASLSIGARSNPRLYAQQGQFLVTNVATPEDFIRQAEKTLNQRFLFAADIPLGLASDALEDLAFMGLTAATMFPGIDGVCKMMRHEMSFRNFGVQAKQRLPAPSPPSDLIAPTNQVKQ